jgi:hypothetical protein
VPAKAGHRKPLMAFAAAIFVVVGFLVLLDRLGLVERSARIIAASTRALSQLADPALDDAAKEAAMRRHAVAIAGQSLALIGAALVALTAPLAPIWGLDLAGLVSLRAVFDALLSWWLILGGTAALVGVLAVRRHRASGSKPAAFSHGYSALDKLLHRVSFATAGVQADLARGEDRRFAKTIAAAPLVGPLFITALPRAGTTMLLDLLAPLDGFASHTYRDMPFVLLPMYWSRLSRRFRATDAPRERAHGDGMLVGSDSPEAFEEMVWMAHWPGRYRPDRILPWQDAGNEAFRGVFERHMRKIVALRRPDAEGRGRYVSKNNLNIARVGWLTHAFAEATVVIPVRAPVQHAASLLRQHRNFLAIHAADGFARHYMAGIGHFDFGANLRPVDFAGWLDRTPHRDATTLGFWLDYWCAAYADLLARRGPRVVLLDYDALCADPGSGLARLAEAVGLADPAALLAKADGIRPAPPREVDLSGVDPAVLARARELHRAATEASIC